MSDLDLYRQTKANEITDVYNINLFKQYSNINKNIFNEINSSNNTIQKQQQISIYIEQLLNKSKELQITYQTDINNAQTLLPIVIQNTNILEKKALLVGINYLNTRYQLNGCWNDVLDVSTRLTQKGFDILNLITDVSTSLIQPTRSNILTYFGNLLSIGNSGDILFFMFSGHGTQINDKSRDEDDSLDERIVAFDSTLPEDYSFQPISDDTLKNLLLNNLKQNVTFVGVFDSCHSGTILDLKYTYLDNKNSNNYSINSLASEASGNIILISGSTDKQTSADAFINGKSNGALTWALLETLNNYPSITWRNLILNMRTLLLNLNYSQVPQLSSSLFIDIDQPILI